MMKKRFWALFLAVMMVVSVLPTSAFAADWYPPYGGGGYPGYPGGNGGGTNDSFVDADKVGETGTVTFRIINGTWTGLPTNTSSGVSFTANEVTFTTKWYSNGNRSGYVYECSNTDDGDNANGAYFETFLLAILGENGEQFIKPNTGYKVDSMDWDFGDDTEGLVNNSGTANAEMEWLSTEEDGYLNIHQCDDSASLQDCFPSKAVYILTLTKDSYTITYKDGVSGAVFTDQAYITKYEESTPAFDSEPDQEGIQEGEPTREGYTLKAGPQTMSWNRHSMNSLSETEPTLLSGKRFLSTL